MTKIHFPQFGNRDYSPFEMRQLIQALELRFASLESETQRSVIPDYDIDELDARYAQIGHTHVVSDITDFPTSVFFFDDVSGTPSEGDTLVWDGATFQTQSVASTAPALDDLTDVEVASVTDLQVLGYDESTLRWRPFDLGSSIVDTLFDLTDTDLDFQLQGDLLFNFDGTNWKPTGQNLQWFEGDYLQFGYGIGINWYDEFNASLEFLAYSGGGNVVSSEVNFAPMTGGGVFEAFPTGSWGTYTNNAGITGLTSGDTYFVTVHGTAGTNTAFATSEARLNQTDGPIPNSTTSGESVQAANLDAVVPLYQWSGTFVSDGTTLEYQVRSATAGINTSGFEAYAINLSNLTTDEYKVDAQTGGTTITAGDPAIGIANVTVTADGDYMVFACGRANRATGGNDADEHEIAITDGTNTYVVSSQDLLAGSKSQNGGVLFKNVTSGTTFTLQHRHVFSIGDFNQTVNVSYSFILALRVDTYDAYVSTAEYNTTSTNDPDLGDAYEWAITSFTAPATGTFQVLGCIANYVESVSEPPQIRVANITQATEGIVTNTPGFVLEDASTRGSTQLGTFTANQGDSIKVGWAAQGAASVTATAGIVISAQNAILGVNKFFVGNAAKSTEIFGTDLVVNPPSTFQSTVDVIGAVTLASTLGVTGATTLFDTLSVTGAATLSSTLGVTGAATLSSTLGVTGATTLSTLGTSGLATLDSLSVTNASTFTGAATHNGTATFNGTADFNSTADFTGATVLGINTSFDMPFGDKLTGTDSNSALQDLIQIETEVTGAAAGDEFYETTSIIASFDGTDEATTFTSEDQFAQTATFVGTAKLDDAATKFGVTSLLLDGNSDLVTFPDSDVYSFDDFDFTIEAWVYFNTVTDFSLVSSYNSNGVNDRGWAFRRNGGALDFIWSTNGTDIFEQEFGTWTPTTGTWYHVAMVRKGDTIRGFVDGVQLGSNFSFTDTIFDAGEPLRVGAISGGSGLTLYLNGRVEDLRITKGVARYIDDFTPPTEAHLTAAPTYTFGDPYFYATTFLVDAEGADAATTYEAIRGGTATFVNNAQIDTAQFRYGTSSFLFDGTNDYITFPNDPSLELGNSDFTLECSVRFNTDPGTGTMSFFGLYDAQSNQRSWSFEINNNTLSILYSTDGTAGTVTRPTGQTWNPVNNQWYDIAVSRQGNNLYWFVDGVLLGSESFTATFFNGTANMIVGAILDGTGTPLQDLDGWLDNIRITKGIARYTDDYTVADKAFLETDPDHDVDWQFVTLRADFDGADAATTFSDQSIAANTLTFNGGAALDDAQKRFGSTSLLIPNTSGDSVDVTSDASLTLGDNDFTIECWVRLNGTGGSGFIYDQRTAATSLHPTIFRNSGTNALTYYVNGAARITGSALSSGQWYHVAVCRVGGTTKMFLDGVQTGSDYTDSNTYASNRVKIGEAGDANGSPLDGWIDDLRVTNGVGRYVEDFIPPALPHPTQAADYDPKYSQVSLMASFDGADEDTAFTSEDSAARTATFVGNAKLDTAVTKFGTTALLLDGTGDKVTFPDSDDFHFAAGDFTMEAWVYISTLEDAIPVITQWGATPQRSFQLAINGSANTIQFSWSTDGSTVTGNVTRSFTWSSATWYHVAACREGTNVRLFVDGVQAGTDIAISTNSLHNSTYVLEIGGRNDNNNYLPGSVADVRITKGFARYTTDFQSPDAALPTVELIPNPSIGGTTDRVLVGDPDLETRMDGSLVNVLNSFRPPVYTDTTRPAASAGVQVIFNTDDGQLNISDGTNWTLPNGTTT